MRNIWVADCETDPFKKKRIPAPFIWGAYNGSAYFEFKTVREFIEFITSQGEIIVYAHNGGKFDWHFILEYLDEFEPIMVINGRLAKFRIGDCEFRDSYNILPIPLSEWQKDEFDYALLEEENRYIPANYAKIQAYLKSDCLNLYNAVSAFIESYGLNLTIAGASMKVWQKLAGEKAPKTNSHFYETIAPYYYGGRVECWETGIIEKTFKVIDINSAYAHAMKHSHPYGDNYDISTELPNSRAYIQRSFIKLVCRSAGAFPYRGDTGLSFPKDAEFRTYTVTGWEFLAAIETRTISQWEIIEVITFSDSIRFDDYIDHFYELKDKAKKEGDKAQYIFSKLFLTNLYGKFGANPENYEEFTIVRQNYIEAAEVDSYGYCADLGPWALVSRPLAEEKSRYYNAAVAASITGFVRAMLWRAINECKGMMYCDTDSIAAESFGNLELDPHKLGAWDVEAECDFAAIGGKKLYAFRKLDGEWKTATKGARLSPDEIVKIAKGGIVEYEAEVPTFSAKRGVSFIKRKISKSG